MAQLQADVWLKVAVRQSVIVDQMSAWSSHALKMQKLINEDL